MNPAYRARRILVLAAIFAGTMLPAPLALAGQNGQQLKFTCTNLQQFYAIGPNQAGKTVTYNTGPGLRGSGITTGWWWVGQVEVKFKVSQHPNTWHYEWIQVPKTYNGDVYGYTCSSVGSPVR